MEGDETLQQVSRCILFCRQNNNENLRIASTWLTEFCSQPLSIQYFFQFINNTQDPTDRQHAIINLDRSFHAVWNMLDPAVQRDYFEQLLHLLLHEPKWINRRNIIDIIHFADNSSFDLLLLNFIKEAAQANQNTYLEMALLLSRLIPANHENHDVNFDVVVPLFQSILEHGLSSDQPEVRLAAFDFFIHSYPLKVRGIIQSHQNYWEPIISSLSMFLSISTQPNGNSLFLRFISLFNEAISEHYLSTEPALVLNQQILSYFAQTLGGTSNHPLDISTFLSLHTIVQYICQNFSEYIYQASIASIQNSKPSVFDELIQMHIFFSNKLFFAEDIYPISNAQFFEQTFKELCVKPELVDRLWNITYSQLSTSQPSSFFIFLRSCASTFERAPELYSQRYQPFCAVLNQSISSGCQLLMDCAARTAREFVTFFFEDTDDLSMELFGPFYESCCKNPSAELIETLTVLLERTRKTDNIFEKPYPFLIEELKTGQPDVQLAVIPCITALCKWSTVKVSAYSTGLLELFTALLKSENETIDTLKSSSVEAVAAIAVSIGLDFVNQGHLIPFFQLFSQIISQSAQHINANTDNTIDIALIIACLKALDQFISAFGKKYIPIGLTQSIIPLLLQIASINFPASVPIEVKDFSQNTEKISSPKMLKSKSFERRISESRISDAYDTFDIIEMKYQAPAWALRCLADICVKTQAIYDQLSASLMQLITMHMQSISEDCRVASAYSIGACVKIVAKRSNRPKSDFATPLFAILTHNIHSMNSMEVNIEVFKTASLIASRTGYDQFFGQLGGYLETIKTIILDPIIQKWRPMNPERDIYDSIAEFLNNLCWSANNEAMKIVSQLIPIFFEMSKMENIRFKSFALRFFTSLIAHGGENVPIELKQNVMGFAMKMAAEGKNYTPYAFITAMTRTEANFAIIKPLLPNIRAMIIEQLKINHECFLCPLMRDLLIRDNCLIALSYIFMENPMEKMVPNLEEIEAFLKEFPPVIDPSGNQTVGKFFIFLYSTFIKSQTSETNKLPENLRVQFLMALVTLFSNPESVILLHINNEDELTKFEEIFLALLHNVPNAQQICQNQLKDDHKMAFLTQSIQRAQNDFEITEA